MSTLSAVRMDQKTQTPGEIELPAPTAWPLVLALGFTLMFAGLLTSASLSVLGVVLTAARRVVERFPIAEDQQRAWLPVHTYPVSAGVKGGLAGSVAMAVVACTYGVLKIGSIWYPINLLAAGVHPQSLKLV